MKPVANPPEPDEAEKPFDFDADTTQKFQARMPAAPVWFSSMVAGNSREKNRLRFEIEQIKGAAQLLMKQRNGAKWTAQDKQEIKKILRSVSKVSPYLLVWVVPGSLLILPFLAWHLDTRRKRRGGGAAQ